MGSQPTNARKPLVWMHKSEYYAEKIISLAGSDHVDTGRILRSLRIHPAWGGGDPIPLRIRLSASASDPLAKIALPRDGSAFLCTARKVSPRETEYAVFCLVGYAIMGYIRPGGQSVTMHWHAENQEAIDARLFAAHLSARIHGGSAKSYLPPAHHLKLV